MNETSILFYSILFYSMQNRMNGVALSVFVSMFLVCLAIHEISKSCSGLCL